MLTLPPGVRVFVATERVDGRKGIDGLSVLVRTYFAEDPLSGRMFVFFSRRADRVRVLYWDRDGYVLITKRLERGSYRLPWRAERGARDHRGRGAALGAGRDRASRCGPACAVVALLACTRFKYCVRSFFVVATESSLHMSRIRAQRGQRVRTEREASGDHERDRS